MCIMERGSVGLIHGLAPAPFMQDEPEYGLDQ